MQLTKPRYIKPQAVRIGDVIRVAWSAGGIQHTRTAKVARREYEGQVRVLYTNENVEILHWIAGARNVRITLLERATPDETNTPLFDLENIK